MRIACSVLVAAAIASPALADRIVFSESFDNAQRTPGASPDVYTMNGTHSWWTYSPSTASVDASAAVGNPASSVVFNDNSTSATGRIEMNMSNFAPFDTAQGVDSPITFSVDMRVDEYRSGERASHFRFVMKDGGRDNPYFTIGFTRALSEWGGRLFLFAGDTGSSSNFFTPGEEHAIGWNAASQSWADGFDFGTFSTGDFGANDTHDEFYRLEVTFHSPANGTQEVQIRATQLSTGQTATATQTVSTPYVFSNDPTDGISVIGGGSARGTAYFDNVRVSVVPEPSSMSLVALGALVAARRRRRRN